MPGMEIKIGCDLVDIKKFKKSAQRGKSKFLDKIFSSYELAGNPKIETLAGIFAAKEAVIKALKMKAGDWRKIEITKNQNGEPHLKIAEPPRKIASQDVSISHDGEYAVAMAVFLINT